MHDHGVDLKGGIPNSGHRVARYVLSHRYNLRHAGIFNNPNLNREKVISPPSIDASFKASCGVDIEATYQKGNK
jgi:hypothetical protein